MIFHILKNSIMAKGSKFDDDNSNIFPCDVIRQQENKRVFHTETRPNVAKLLSHQ
jgi:hypothetical protein